MFEDGNNDQQVAVDQHSEDDSINDFVLSEIEQPQGNDTYDGIGLSINENELEPNAGSPSIVAEPSVAELQPVVELDEDLLNRLLVSL